MDYDFSKSASDDVFLHLDHQLDGEGSIRWNFPGTPEEAQQLIERGRRLDEALVAAIKAIPGVKSVGTSSHNFQITYRDIMFRFVGKVFRPSKGSRYATSWAISFEMSRKLRGVMRRFSPDNSDDFATFYGTPTRDASARAAAAWLAQWLESHYESSLVEVAKDNARRQREKKVEEIKAKLPEGVSLEAGFGDKYELKAEIAPENLQRVLDLLASF